MGIIFQPRPPVLRAATGRRDSGNATTSRGREAVFAEALESVVRGDTSRFDQLFTEDVVFYAPHVKASSLAGVRAAVGQPEDTLHEIAIDLNPRAVGADELVAEWRLSAMFDRPALFDDNVLVEPTWGVVQMSGSSFATFTGDRISSFRHYFDDSELLDRVAGVPAHLRWSARRR